MSEQPTDDFMRAVGDDDGALIASDLKMRVSTGLRSTSSAKKKDPYDLDFTALRKQYVKESSVKLPFVKSSFTHYSKCPRNMIINDKEYKDLVITMEIVQAPENLKYTQLDDPVEARKKIAAAKRKEEIEKKKQEIIAERLAEREQRKVERAARKAMKEARKAQREHDRNNGIQGSDDDDEEESESEEEEDGDIEDEIDDDEIEAMLDGLLDMEGSDEDETDEAESEESPSDYGSEDFDGEDREYTGDMFKKNKSIKFSASPFEHMGQHNAALETNDYCCISLWSTGGKLQRYTRLKSTTLRVPPIGTSRKFRVGHDAKRLYYLGEQRGVKKLVIVYL